MGKLTSILKKMCDSHEKPLICGQFKDQTYDMEDFLKRIVVTGLQSTYSQQIQDLSEYSAEQQVVWLRELTSKNVILDSRAYDFVQNVLAVPWKFEESRVLLNVYKEFLMNVAIGPNEYCKIIIRHLLAYFLPDVESNNEVILRLNPNECPASTINFCNLAIDTLVFIHSRVPLSEKIIIDELIKNKPHFSCPPYKLIVFIKSLLILGERMPNLKQKLIELVFHCILQVDLQCSRSSLMPDEDESEVFEMEIDNKSEPSLESQTLERIKWIDAHPMGHKLDSAMTTVIAYLHCVLHGVTPTFNTKEDFAALQKLGCQPGLVLHATKADGCCQCGGKNHDVKMVSQTYKLFKDAFTKIILPTPLSGHIQFIMYYLLGLRTSLATSFIEDLRKNFFINTSCSTEVRRNAMSYIGSFIVRCRYLQFSLVHSTLEMISKWCTDYLSNQKDSANFYSRAGLHPVFYTACQTIFYVFTFRYNDYSKSLSTMKLVNNLAFQPIITSNLNPLAVCHENIVNSFAAITNHFQFSYCYTILERNKRGKLAISKDYAENKALGSYIGDDHLECFFPFDPYLLIGSRELINNVYQEFEGLPEGVNANFDFHDTSEEKETEETDDTEDNFLEMSGNNSVHMNSFVEFQFSTSQDG